MVSRSPFFSSPTSTGQVPICLQCLRRLEVFARRIEQRNAFAAFRVQNRVRGSESAQSNRFLVLQSSLGTFVRFTIRTRSFTAAPAIGITSIRTAPVTAACRRRDRARYEFFLIPDPFQFVGSRQIKPVFDSTRIVERNRRERDLALHRFLPGLVKFLVDLQSRDDLQIRRSPATRRPVARARRYRAPADAENGHADCATASLDSLRTRNSVCITQGSRPSCATL